MSEEITKTTDFSDSEGIDESTRKYLNQYNPNGEFARDESFQTTATVEDIKIPEPREIISEESAEIKIILSHSDIEDKITMPIALDRFSKNNSKRRGTSATKNTHNERLVSSGSTMSSLENMYDIDRFEIEDLIGSEIRISARKKGSSYLARPTYGAESLEKSSDEKEIENLDSLKELWEAEEYGKAKIVSIDASVGDRASISIEIPWVNEKKKLLLGVGPSSPYASIESLFKSVMGHAPMHKDEISGLVGKEINVSYQGKFGLTERLVDEMNENSYSFREFVVDNDETVKQASVKNAFFATLFYAMPPFVVVPVVLLNPLFAISTVLGILGAAGLVGITAVVFTLFSARKSYKNGKSFNIR